MSPTEVLQSAGAELERLTEQLVHDGSTANQPLHKVEQLIDKLLPLEHQLSFQNAAELQAVLQTVLTKAKRVQALLEAGTVFHCNSIFGRPETPHTYGSDGTFSASHDSRITFEG
jgi:hypothetical protein